MLIRFKKYLFLLIFILVTKPTDAQNWKWLRTANINCEGEGTSVCTDAFGNVISSGYFDSYEIVFGTYTLTNNMGMNTLYIVKYDSIGNVLWAKNPYGASAEAEGVCSDSVGNIFLTGNFSYGDVIFGNDTLINYGQKSSFLVKYDPNGNVLWTRGSRNSGDCEPKSISNDSYGNIYISGNYNTTGSLIFGIDTLTSIGGGFLTKYDLNGNVLWAKQINGSYLGVITVANDKIGNIFIAGTGAYSSNSFLSKYDINGNIAWVKSAQNGIGFSSEVRDISIDINGNIYLVGSFTGTLSFGSNSVTGANDIFLAQFDNSGNSKWVRDIGGVVGTEVGYEVAAYSLGVFATGSMYGDFTINNYTFTPSAGYIADPMIIVQYDQNGNFLYGNCLSSGGDDKCAITTDNFNNVIIAGDIYAVSPFILGSDTVILSLAETPFVAKFSYSPYPNLVGLKEFKNKEDIILFPNPVTTDVINISMPNENSGFNEVIVANYFGQIVITQVLDVFKGTIALDLKEIEAGVYLVQIKNRDKTYFKQFVKFD